VKVSRYGIACYRASVLGKGKVIGGDLTVTFDDTDEVEDEDAKLWWYGVNI